MEHSFQRGFNQIQVGKTAEVKEKLMAALSITTRNSWSSRLKGKVEPKRSEAHAIEKIFAEYGVKDVWGLPPQNSTNQKTN